MSLPGKGNLEFPVWFLGVCCCWQGLVLPRAAALAPLPFLHEFFSKGKLIKHKTLSSLLPSCPGSPGSLPRTRYWILGMLWEPPRVSRGSLSPSLPAAAWDSSPWIPFLDSSLAQLLLSLISLLFLSQPLPPAVFLSPCSPFQSFFPLWRFSLFPFHLFFLFLPFQLGENLYKHFEVISSSLP